MKDWRGRDITVGCTIVYPVRHGSSLHLTEATVEIIKADSLTVHAAGSSGWRSHQPRARPRVVLHALKQVTVVDVNEDTRTVKSLATMLGWENVPPRETLERDIAALKSRRA